MGIQIKKGQRISQFMVLDVLPEGSGGMATVVRAAARDGSEVALKISHRAENQYYTAALIKETEILQELQHQGVVKIMAIYTSNGKSRYMERATELPNQPWYFIMEFLPGGSLRELVKKTGNLAPGEASFIAREVARALHYIHSRNYVHNDVKDDNVLFRQPVEKGGVFVPVLIDFGIAAKLRSQPQDAGTLAWMSPERLQQVREELPPEANVDASRMDIYSVGVLLYKMLTGKMPFIGSNEGNLTSAILHKAPDGIKQVNPRVPKGLDELTLACMAKRPEARPSSERLISSLKEFSTDRIVSAPKQKSFLSFG